VLRALQMTTSCDAGLCRAPVCPASGQQGAVGAAAGHDGSGWQVCGLDIGCSHIGPSGGWQVCGLDIGCSHIGPSRHHTPHHTTPHHTTPHHTTPHHSCDTPALPSCPPCTPYRCVGLHRLLLLNFYPFMQKYIAPHQRDVHQARVGCGVNQGQAGGRRTCDDVGQTGGFCGYEKEKGGARHAHTLIDTHPTICACKQALTACTTYHMAACGPLCARRYWQRWCRVCMSSCRPTPWHQ
jgi:hypothetical protein